MNSKEIEKRIALTINEYGSVLSDMKDFCNSKCMNLTDTHELTLAEKNCTLNCFKKLNYAYNNFNRLTNEKIALENLSEPNREFKI